MRMKSRVLFVMQLPPPVHGTSMMNKYILDSDQVNSAYEYQVLPLKFVNKVSEIGSFSFQKIYLMLGFVLRLFKTIRKFKPDIIYFTIAPFGFAFYRDALFVSVIKLFSGKLVLHLHGKGISQEAQAKWKRLIYRSVFRNTHVITLSKTLDYDIASVYSGKPYNLGNGIPVHESANSEIKLNSGRDTVKLLYLSNLVKSKGILDLIDAIELIKNDDLNFELNLVGNSSDISIEEVKLLIAQKGLQNLVHVLGPMYGDDKWEILRKSDVFVFPTYYKNECFPLSILEAMQFGCVVVSTNNGAIEEMIGGCGVVVAQRDTNALSQEIRSLIQNSNKRKILSKEAKNVFNSQYTLGHFEDNFLAILRGIENKKA